MDMQTQFHAQDESIVVASAQDVEPIIDSCRDRQDRGMVGSSEMRHAARIPMVVIEHYCNRLGISFQDWCRDKSHVKRMLNDPDLKAFRIWHGAV